MKYIKKLRHFCEAVLANVYYRFPSRGMKIIGVTGTDGKTTTTLMIYHILKKQGLKAGYVSTVGFSDGGRPQDSGLHITTPSPFKLQGILQKAARNKVDYMVLEVSSHGLLQFRVLGINFQVSALTNITNEHLDYHKTYNNYLLAKSRLFEASKINILNADDKSYSKLSRMFPEAKTYSLNKKNVDYSLKNIKIKLESSHEYNYSNALAAVAAINSLGIDIKDIVQALKTFKFPDGRGEHVVRKPYEIVIDFAHTPNALLGLFSGFEKHKGKIIHVFGSAGERYFLKRPVMGSISARFSDVIILTSEDPRKESIVEINAQIKKGIRKEKYRGLLIEENDRRQAILTAVRMLKAGDLLLITGKGQEKSNNINGVEHPWDERKAVEEALKKAGI